MIDLDWVHSLEPSKSNLMHSLTLKFYVIRVVVYLTFAWLNKDIPCKKSNLVKASAKLSQFLYCVLSSTLFQEH